MVVGGDRTIYDILRESNELCKSSFSLHFIDEVPEQSTGLIFVKDSNYTEAFSVIVAERLGEFSLRLHKRRAFTFHKMLWKRLKRDFCLFSTLYERTLQLVTKLSGKCQHHFFSTSDVEIKYESISLSRFFGVFLCLLAALSISLGAFIVELLFSIM